MGNSIDHMIDAEVLRQLGNINRLAVQCRGSADAFQLPRKYYGVDNKNLTKKRQEFYFC
jgi:hypothetical protein